MKARHRLQTRSLVAALVAAMLQLAVNSAWAYYNPHAGRWLNRDPIGERGGPNSYCFNQNEPVGKIDRIGLRSTSSGPNLTFFGEIASVGECGGFMYRSTWSLDLDKATADSNVGGIIVQNVQATFDVHSCGENKSTFHFGPPSSHPVNPGDWPFYEAWSIPPGMSRPSQGFHDYWQMPSFGIGTQGSITIIGAADYFDGQKMPWNFSPGNAGPSGSQLPTSSWFLPPGSPTSSISRTLTVTWDCCCRKERNQITVTPDSYSH